MYRVWIHLLVLARRAELLRGPLYYVLVLLGTTLVYWRESPVGVVVFSLMCGGDGLVRSSLLHSGGQKETIPSFIEHLNAFSGVP